jgi:hypothetical protein
MWPARGRRRLHGGELNRPEAATGDTAATAGELDEADLHAAVPEPS